MHAHTQAVACMHTLSLGAVALVPVYGFVVAFVFLLRFVLQC